MKHPLHFHLFKIFKTAESQILMSFIEPEHRFQISDFYVFWNLILIPLTVEHVIFHRHTSGGGLNNLSVAI